MNRRKNDDIDEYCVERQQKALAKSFTLFKVVIAVLALCSAVALAFALHYTL